MFPLILIYHDEKSIEDYLGKYISENNFLSYNIFKIFPVKREISIAQIRELRKIMSIGINQKRLFILYSFHNSTIEAQNALLKHLEEKNFSNQFIFLVENEYLVLPTIRSRSSVVNLINKNKLDKKNSSPNIIATIENSSSFEFLADNKITNISRENALDLINKIILYYERKIAEYKSISPLILNTAMKTKTFLENNYLNPQASIDNLLISIKKIYKMK